MLSMASYGSLGNSPQKMPEGEPLKTIRGSFACQVCNERVTEARYAVQIRAMDYTCTKGHRSIIKDFELD